MRILLAGQPNCGKTTLFNALTGRRAPTGNRPGVTVEAVRGIIRGTEDMLLDLPGLYALSGGGPDEALARQIEEQHRERVSPFAFSKCGISEGAELEFCCRGNEQPASAAPSPTTSMCAFRTKYGPWPHWRSICWGPGIRSPGLSIPNTTARG